MPESSGVAAASAPRRAEVAGGLGAAQAPTVSLMTGFLRIIPEAAGGPGGYRAPRSHSPPATIVCPHASCPRSLPSFTNKPNGGDRHPGGSEPAGVWLAAVMRLLGDT